MEFLGGKNMNFKMIHQNFNVFDLDKSIYYCILKERNN